MGPSQGVRIVVGKQAVFALAAMVLGDLKQSHRGLSRYETRVLREASVAIHNAHAWHRFAGQNRAPCPGEEAKGAYELFSRAAGPVQSGDAWLAYWGEVRGAGCTLEVLAGGGKCDSRQLVATEQLCTMVSGMSSVAMRPRSVS